MKIKIYALAATFILLILAARTANAQEQSQPRPRIPSMSNDDIGERPPRAASSDVATTDVPVPSTASPAQWKNVPAALARVSSFRARIINAVPNAPGEVTIEVSLPDRFHETMAGKVEVIAIGSSNYVKVGNQAWSKAQGPDSGGPSFKDIFSRAFDGVKSARLVGTDSLDGVATNIFEIVSVSRAGKTLTQRVWAGQADSLPRKIEEPREGMDPVTMLFYDYNTAISIAAPM